MGFITSLCGDNRYKGVAQPLFNFLSKYSAKKNYIYHLLHVSKERKYLKEFYEKIEFVIDKELTDNNDDFYIMHKYIV